MKRSFFALPGIAAACLLLFCAATGASDHLSTPDYAAQIEQLIAEARRIDPLVEESSGDLKALFELRRAEKERRILKLLNQYVDSLSSTDTSDPAVAQAIALVERFTDVVLERASRQQSLVFALAMEAPALTATGALAYEVTIDTELNKLIDWYQHTADINNSRKKLGLDNNQTETFLANELPELAEMIASAIALSIEQSRSIRFQQNIQPDDAELEQAGQVVAFQRKYLARTLSDTADIMDSAGLDTADYRSLVIIVTGDISTGALSVGVVQSLLRQWTKKFRDWFRDNGPNFFVKLLLFLLIGFVALMLSRLTRRIVQPAVDRLHFSQLLNQMVVSVAANVVLFLGILVALSQLGISLGPLLAGLGVIGFIVGFALQDTLGNFASGMMILIYRPYDTGDMIEAAGVLGTVDDMSLVSTVILTPDNQKLVVPNSKIWGDVIRNVYARDRRRVDLFFDISYDDDLPAAEKLLLDLLKEHETVLEQPEPVVKVHELTDSSVRFAVRPWVKSSDYWDTYWDITRKAKLALSDSGFTIPYPQRDVHMKNSGSNS